MISLFWDSETDALRFWYIDLVTPLRRTAVGFEWVDHGVDVVVEPDMRSWSWKDADELDWYVEHGRYSRAEADHIRSEAEAAVARLRRDQGRFKRWLEWRPDPSWQVPTLPDGWDVA
jgi:predicted RNA-binding protein associated with RNAse of E/G family